MLTTEDYQRQYENLEDFCKVFKDINELMNWYKYNNIIWPHNDDKEYNERYMSWADDILKYKTGNCFDHAMFVYCFCKKNDIPCKVYRISIFAEPVFFVDDDNRYKSYDHIVASAKFLDKWYVFDYVEDPFSNLFGPSSNLHDLMEDYKNRYTNGMISFIKENHDPYFYRFISESYMTELSDKDLEYIISLYNDHYLTQKEISQHCSSYKLLLDTRIMQRTLLESISYKLSFHIKNFIISIFHL